MKRLLAFVALVGCSSTPSELPPSGQVLLYFDTDAPVPPGGGRSTTRDEPTPLFDTIRVELLDPGSEEACAACVREFPVDAEKFAAAAVSVGIPTRPGIAGYRVRATLFLQSWVLPCALYSAGDQSLAPECVRDPSSRAPHPATVIRRTVALPPVAAEGIVELTVPLSTDETGVAAGSPAAPLDPISGRPGASKVGSWPGATREGCSTAPREDEACVPGGAFWKGNARIAEDFHQTVSPRLVVVAPYFMKKAEVTIAECRSVAGCHASAKSTAPVLTSYFCDYTAAAGAKESLPVNCVVYAGQKAYCDAWGGELPTLAQLGYAMSGTVGTTYVWGNDDPGCEDAMWGRGNENDTIAKGPCYRLPRGPYRAGSGLRDRLELPTGTIVDLAGNLSEWARDPMPDGCKCVFPPGVLHDPICSGNPANQGATGGAWSYGASSLGASQDACAPKMFVGSMLGFRCTRPGR